MSVETELDDHAAKLAFTADELDAVRKYQSDQPAPLGWAGAKWHELTNRYLRNQSLIGVGSQEIRTIARVIRDLDSAIARSRLSLDVVAYRAVSQADTVAELAALIEHDLEAGIELALPGFVSSSLSRQRAERFLNAPVHLVLEMHAQAGTPALWVPGVGDPAFAGQHELLFGSATRIRVQELIESADLAITVAVEVMP